MGQQEPISRYAYIVVALFATLQSVIILYSTDYTVRQESGLSGQFVYLPLLLAVFVPSAISYLITNAKSAIFYLNILIIILLTIWISLWHARHSESSTDASPFIAFTTLIVLLFFLLPWMQMRQLEKTWKIDYACLMGFYIKNTLLGIFASAIGGLLVTLILLANFLFKIVNLSSLSQLLSNDLTLWAGFTLGFNIGLIFLRSTFELQFGKFIRYIARFFLIILHIIAIVFVIGFIFSYFTGMNATGLGSAAMLWFLILNIILINLVYGDGTQPYQFSAWLNPFVLFSVLLLNFFSLLSIYGILIRVNQYSWSIERLYAFTIALFLAIIIFAYSIAVLRKRTHWIFSLGTINKFGLLGLIGTILVINSPIADFKRITLNSILSGIDNGKIKVDSMLAYDLDELGPNGQQALKKLKSNPEYKKLLEHSSYGDEPRKSLEDVLVLAKNSAELPKSWWDMEDKEHEYYCISLYHSYNCLGFMADANQDGQDDVVMCYASEDSGSFDCIIWQEKHDTWSIVDRQANHYQSVEERDQAWQKLLDGQFNLKPKEWRQIIPQ
ncbi:hypothetical protein AHYW_003096 [Providencia manganoxydans]|uniref:DUF7057 domain-containing protein n=1 Tax=Providencia manganoxydans TaxID=2923283 RepID=UPI003B9CD301